MTDLNYNPQDPDKMQFPVGKTCGDCTHIPRCKAIFGHTETDTYCDWSPSRAVFSQQLRKKGGAA
ncbi:hypothetical protein [Klebsiella pasteurii]|jgi:hypothetical protein|uniref:hypothetical protein n=1 Tax=Klebsiella pasteurii TaxID=2587529 RepID=UPI00292DF36A|nr:hypothetical protein [Klebsiella pasteurii]